MSIYSMGIQHRRNRGFSLVELMVSMTLGLIILLAISELFVNNSRTRSEIERTSRQIENGRYAIQLLTDELSNAGFFGETGAQDFPAALPPACASSETDITDAMGVPVFGQNNLASASAPNCLSNYKDGNDYVALRRASSCEAGSANCDDFSDGAYHVQVSACQTDSPGEVTLGTDEADMTATTRTCVDGAPVYRLLSRIYYINSTDTLMRAELGDPDDTSPYTITSLVDGIEHLHFEYGIDSSGDGVPDSYASAPSTANWKDVVAVRVWLLARNLDETLNYTDDRTYRLGDIEVVNPGDGFKRQVYSTTVRVNNVAGRRE
nr:PilW family protein [uncultured Pseudomonas sp.]